MVGNCRRRLLPTLTPIADRVKANVGYQRLLLDLCLKAGSPARNRSWQHLQHSFARL
jgi:hypothetical protein